MQEKWGWGWTREGVVLVSITAAVACFMLAAQPYVAGGHIDLMSVLGMRNLSGCHEIVSLIL